MKSLIMHPDTARELERQTKEGQAKLFMGYRIVETKHCPRPGWLLIIGIAVIVGVLI